MRMQSVLFGMQNRTFGPYVSAVLFPLMATLEPGLPSLLLHIVLEMPLQKWLTLLEDCKARCIQAAVPLCCASPTTGFPTIYALGVVVVRDTAMELLRGFIRGNSSHAIQIAALGLSDAHHATNLNPKPLFHPWSHATHVVCGQQESWLSTTGGASAWIDEAAAGS
jgi:hypothetical protein